MEMLPDELRGTLRRLEERLTALEAARAQDMADVPGIVVTILKREMPPLLRSVINEERLVADAQRFRAAMQLGRRIVLAVILALATGAAGIMLNSMLR